MTTILTQANLYWYDLSGLLREQNLRLLLAGAAAAALIAIVQRQLPGRATPGALVGAAASALGLYLTDWLDRLDWAETGRWRFIAAATVAALAGLGFERLRAASRVQRWVPALVLLTCCGGIWLGVPENSPIVVVGGIVGGLSLAGRMNAAGVGYGLTAAAAWSVLIGARSTGYSFDGGLLSLAPLAAIPLVEQLRRRRRFNLPAWPWLVAGSGGIAFAAGRWVGVAPDATWLRISVISAAAVLLVRVAGAVK